MGGMVGERGERAMEPGIGSLSCGLPPCFRSFLNFDLLFWNHIFTCKGWWGGGCRGQYKRVKRVLRSDRLKRFNKKKEE